MINVSASPWHTAKEGLRQNLVVADSARALGCPTVDGGTMAVGQAVGAFELFTGQLPFTGKNAQETMIAPKDIIAYPADWPAISFRRGEPLEFVESEADRAVLDTLRNTSLPVELNNNAFEDVVGFISSTARVDIDVDWESLADIGVDPDTPVTATNIPSGNVTSMSCRLCSLAPRTTSWRSGVRGRRTSGTGICLRPDR